jgi:microcystin-dependent protein
VSEPFIGEIRIFSFSFAPKNWAFCDGQILPINQNQALYALLGNQFGGSAPVNFALPDLRGRTGLDDVWNNSDYMVGNTAGTESVVLQTIHIPKHTHYFRVVGDVANRNVPTGLFYAQVSPSPVPNTIYASSSSNLVALHSSTITSSGSSQAHGNMQPFTVVNFCIATTGIFPPRS